MHARWLACKSEPFTFRLNHLQVVKLAGLETYLAKAEKPLPGAPAVVLIHDIFGWEAKNVRLYADKMAQQGALWPSGAAHREYGRVACHSHRPACARRRSARKLGHACRRSGLKTQYDLWEGADCVSPHCQASWRWCRTFTTTRR